MVRRMTWAIVWWSLFTALTAVAGESFLVPWLGVVGSFVVVRALIIGTAVYLGYRAFQGFEWLVNNDHTPIAIILGVVLVVGAAAGARWWFSRDEDADPPAAGGSDPQPSAGGA